MKAISYIFPFAVIGVLSISLPLTAAEPPSIKHNPFARPDSRSADPIARSGDGNTRGFVLKATMVSPDHALANVSGRVIRPGEEIQGYTLIRVYEDRAVFRRNGNTLTLFVKPERRDDSDRAAD